MGCHDELTAPLDACTEGHHLADLHLLPSLQRLCVTRVRVGRRVTVAGEMLDAACDARILQTLQIAGHHRCSYGRIIAEGTGTDDDILRIGIHVGHGSEVDVKVVALQIRADGVAAFVGVLWVASGTDSSHRLILFDIEVRIVRNACHAASFLVDAEQRMAVQ